MFVEKSTFTLLYTNNLENTKSFYTQIGSEIIEDTEGKLVVKLADLELHFILSATEVFENYQYVIKEPYGQGVLFYIGVDNLQDAKNIIEAAGSPLIFPIQSNHWGSEEFLFEDPNGFKIVIYRNV